MLERRTDPRIPTTAPVSIRPGLAAMTEDLSASGVRLRTSVEIPVGTRVQLTIHGMNDVDVEAVVVRQILNQKRPRPTVALRFARPLVAEELRFNERSDLSTEVA